MVLAKCGGSKTGAQFFIFDTLPIKSGVYTPLEYGLAFSNSLLTNRMWPKRCYMTSEHRFEKVVQPLAIQKPCVGAAVPASIARR